jgi:hypothetical protein
MIILLVIHQESRQHGDLFKGRSEDDTSLNLMNLPDSNNRGIPELQSLNQRATISRNQDGFGGLPICGGGEGFVGLGEFETVGDHFVKWESVAIGAKKIEGGAEVAGFTRPGAENLQLFPRDDVGIEFDAAGVAVMAEN